MTRAERERAAYDEHGVFEHSHGWHVRFRHVFESPNTREHERVFSDLVKARIAGARVLEIGCGDGSQARELSASGAAYVLGVDISETFIARAKQDEVPGRLEFALADASQPVEGAFDIVFGRAILHHLDYRPVLERLYQANLRPGGLMAFMEPLGSNLLIRIFHAVSPAAHTPDERSFERADLRWFRATFPRVEILPINYLSFPLGLLSSLVFRRPDNLMLKAGDQVDRWLARRVPALAPNFRQAILVIRK